MSFARSITVLSDDRSEPAKLGEERGSSMIRVLHVITGLGVGGAEAMLQKLIARSDRGRFEHVVISLMDSGVVGEQLKKQGVTVHALGGPRGYLTWRVLHGLIRVVRRIEPEIIQGWMYHGNLAAWLARRFSADAPSLIWGIRQSLGPLSNEKRLTRFVIRVSAPLSANVDMVVYNAQRSRVQHEVVGLSGRSSSVIPNGFDTARFIPSSSANAEFRRELNIPGEAFVVGLVGRFHPMKDHRGFLEAAVEIAKLNGNVRFLMAGEGVSQESSELSQWIRELGLRDRVHLLGRRDDIPSLMAALDVAVSASARNEGFANVIGEAMSCGVPCVVTDVGDSALIVSDTGRVVPPGNPAKLAVAICELLELNSEERKQLGVAARARIISEFSIEKAVGRFEAIYSDLTQATGREKSAFHNNRE